MKTFAVYQHPSKGYEAVKRGFSWPAFLFCVWWMLAKRLWTHASIWIVAILACRAIDRLVQDAASVAALLIIVLVMVVSIALWLLPAFEGNQWRERALRERGYRSLGTVECETPEAAVVRCAMQPVSGPSARAGLSQPA